jgi:hypothetical protein
MPTIHAPPRHHSSSNGPRPTSAARVDADGVPDEPPPAYTAAPGVAASELSIAQGPQFMDFGGPPPSNFQPTPPQRNLGALNTPRPPLMGNANHSWAGPSSSAWAQSGRWSPSGRSSPSLPSHQDYQTSISTAPLSGPTEIATPGRPLLREGKVLIFPTSYFCSKCGSFWLGVSILLILSSIYAGNNTGFKNDDPHHPCKTVSPLDR